MSLDVIVIVVGSIFCSLMIFFVYFTNRDIQPKQLFLLFFTEMWERFSFYGMRALLILYMTNVLLFKDKESNLMYGAYNALVYITPLFGGIIADRILGFRKSIIFGGIMMAIGHLVLAIPIEQTFFLGLGFLIIGNGFFKPNISSFLGKYYEENDKRRDAGYAIFYMGINVGGFLGSAICGYLGQKISWHLGFGVAGIFMIIGLITFLLNRKMLEGKGESSNLELLNSKSFVGINWEKTIYIGALLSVAIAVEIVLYNNVTQVIFGIVGIITIAYILFVASIEEHKPMQMLWAALTMIIFSTLFWAFYEQAGGSLNLMAERNVDMNVGGTKLSSAMVNNSINPFYIIVLTPIFALMWSWLDKRNLKPNDPVKFGLSFIFLAIGYYAFVEGGTKGLATGYMPLIYFCIGYFFITVGELFISPIGLSMVTKLSPAKIVGFMMGTWFLASAFGHELAGWIGSKMAIPETNIDGTPFTVVQSLPIYLEGCKEIAIISVIAAIVIIPSSLIIKKWMHGVK
ncbi:MAG: peptide MFS transporter [Sphingobacteriales bacterium]|nr:MAG: peptide MFS transporter [Sphingobacteriales bacterium]